MISAIVRTALTALRRDRASLALSFLLPIAFFSIFAVIFGGQHNSTPKIAVIVVDEDQSSASHQLFQALQREGSLAVQARPAAKKGIQQPEYTAVTAESAVKSGDAQVALIIPHGFGQNPISFGPTQSGSSIELLNDSSDMIAPQMVAVYCKRPPLLLCRRSWPSRALNTPGNTSAGLLPSGKNRMDENLAHFRQLEKAPAANRPTAANPCQWRIIAVIPAPSWKRARTWSLSTLPPSA